MKSVKIGSRYLNFSQRYGYKDVPQQLKLEELPRGARVQIWNCVLEFLRNHGSSQHSHYEGTSAEILKSVYLEFLGHSLDEFSTYEPNVDSRLKKLFCSTLRFYELFDLLELIMKHNLCPIDFVHNLQQIFIKTQLAYSIVETENFPPIIVPISNSCDREILIEALNTADENGFDTVHLHLANSINKIKQEDWNGSVRESVSALESVVKILAERESTSFSNTLKSLMLHKALEQGIVKLYGYASNKPGVRHAKLSPEDTEVTLSESLLVLGICSSLTSYLIRENID